MHKWQIYSTISFDNDHHRNQEVVVKFNAVVTTISFLCGLVAYMHLRLLLVVAHTKSVERELARVECFLYANAIPRSNLDWGGGTGDGT